jgi:hypothetical protein
VIRRIGENGMGNLPVKQRQENPFGGAGDILSLLTQLGESRWIARKTDPLFESATVTPKRTEVMDDGELREFHG